MRKKLSNKVNIILNVWRKIPNLRTSLTKDAFQGIYKREVRRRVWNSLGWLWCFTLFHPVSPIIETYPTLSQLRCISLSIPLDSIFWWRQAGRQSLLYTSVYFCELAILILLNHINVSAIWPDFSFPIIRNVFTLMSTEECSCSFYFIGFVSISKCIFNLSTLGKGRNIS